MTAGTPATPGRFNGIALDAGQHLDSMRGGSWLIQLVSCLYRGLPTEQNKAASQIIMAGWVNDIFAGRIDPVTGLMLARSPAIRLVLGG